MVCFGNRGSVTIFKGGGMGGGETGIPGEGGGVTLNNKNVFE